MKLRMVTNISSLLRSWIGRRPLESTLPIVFDNWHGPVWTKPDVSPLIVFFDLVARTIYGPVDYAYHMKL